jgi:hypothetical protein
MYLILQKWRVFAERTYLTLAKHIFPKEFLQQISQNREILPQIFY